MTKFTIPRIIYFKFALIISFIYIYIISTFPNDWFRDRNFYLIYANEAESIIESSGLGIGLFVNEPIFLRLAQFFGNHLSADLFPIAMSIFVASIYVLTLVFKSRTIIMFLLGVMSLVVVGYLQTAQVMVLRQGVATAIFLIAFLLIKNEKKKLAVCLSLALFHSVFFIISGIYALYIFYLKNKGTKQMLLIVAFVAAILFASSSFLLSYLGFRQAELYSTQTSAGGGGSFVLSILIFIYLYLFGNKEDKQLYDWSLIGLVLFIVGYFLFFSAGRLYVSFFPFILMLLVTKSRLQDILFLSFINLIYIMLFYFGSYMILFEYTSSGEIIVRFIKHMTSTFSIF